MVLTACAKIGSISDPTKRSVLRRHSGGGSVMAWEAFSGNETSELKIFVGKQDSFNYVSTLQTQLQPFIDTETQFFQQDNGPCYKSSVSA